jgi:hypothetical protein
MQAADNRGMAKRKSLKLLVKDTLNSLNCKEGASVGELSRPK